MNFFYSSKLSRHTKIRIYWIPAVSNWSLIIFIKKKFIVRTINGVIQYKDIWKWIKRRNDKLHEFYDETCVVQNLKSRTLDRSGPLIKIGEKFTPFTLLMR